MMREIGFVVFKLAPLSWARVFANSNGYLKWSAPVFHLELALLTVTAASTPPATPPAKSERAGAMWCLAL